MITVPRLTSRGGATTFLGGKDDELELLLVEAIDWIALKIFIDKKRVRCLQWLGIAGSSCVGPRIQGKC